MIRYVPYLMNYTMNRSFDRLESAKLRALRTKNVSCMFTCSRANVP